MLSEIVVTLRKFLFWKNSSLQGPDVIPDICHHQHEEVERSGIALRTLGPRLAFGALAASC